MISPQRTHLSNERLTSETIANQPRAHRKPSRRQTGHAFLNSALEIISDNEAVGFLGFHLSLAELALDQPEFTGRTTVTQNRRVEHRCDGIGQVEHFQG
jgi:hypothetical protein